MKQVKDLTIYKGRAPTSQIYIMSNQINRSVSHRLSKEVYGLAMMSLTPPLWILDSLKDEIGSINRELA